MAISVPILGKFFQLLCPQVFSHALSFCLLFWDSYDLNVGAFNIVSEVSEVVLIYFFLFSFISTILSSTSLILCSASVILLLVPPECF